MLVPGDRFHHAAVGELTQLIDAVGPGSRARQVLDPPGSWSALRRSYRRVITVLHGSKVTVRSADAADVFALVTIRASPEVQRWWGGSDDLTAEILDDIATPDLHVFVIEEAGRVVGAIQWQAEADPMYRHAGIDLYLDPSVHHRGLGADAVRTLARHLVEDHGHHRLVIDPAAANEAAIRCYAKVGFRTVGVMRRYERGQDGTWHDGLLMELLAEDLTA